MPGVECTSKGISWSGTSPGTDNTRLGYSPGQPELNYWSLSATYRSLLGCIEAGKLSIRLWSTLISLETNSHEYEKNRRNELGAMMRIPIIFILPFDYNFRVRSASYTRRVVY